MDKGRQGLLSLTWLEKRRETKRKPPAGGSEAFHPGRMPSAWSGNLKRELTGAGAVEDGERRSRSQQELLLLFRAEIDSLLPGESTPQGRGFGCSSKRTARSARRCELSP